MVLRYCCPLLCVLLVCLASLPLAAAQNQADIDEINALINRGVALTKEGKHGERAQVLEKLLAKLRQQKPVDDETLATVATGLADSYREIAQYSKAEPLYLEGLHIREAKLGKDHPDVATSLNNLGELYRTIGHYAKAEPLYLRSLKIYEAKLGKDHPNVAFSLNNLALLYEHMGQYAKAEPLFKRSLHIWEFKLGKDHPEVATSLNNLALLYEHTGQYAKAEPLYRRSLEILEVKLGKNHPNVAQSLNNLATLYRTMGQYAQAEPLFKRSLHAWEAQLGVDHPGTAISLSNLAGLYRTMGQYAQAEPLYQRGLQIFEAQLGKDHPHVATCLNDLALLYDEMGQYAQAEPLYQRSLEIKRVQLGKDHPATALTLANLAALHGSQQFWPAARQRFDQARRGTRNYVAQVLPALSSDEQMVFLAAKDSVSLHSGLSLTVAQPRDTATVTASAGWLLNGKAVALQALAERELLARQSNDPATSATAKELTGVRQQLAAITLRESKPGEEKTRAQGIERMKDREAELSKTLGQALGRATGNDPWIELDDIRKNLPNGNVLIEIARFDQYKFVRAKDEKDWQPAHYAAWLIPPAGQGDVKFIDLGLAEPIDDAIKAVRRGLDPQKEMPVRGPLKELSKLILHPLLEHLGTADKLILSPDADLWLVPWSALVLPDDRYAIEKYTLSYVVSGRDLLNTPPKGVTTTGPLVIADPDYDLSSSQKTAKPQAANETTRSGALGKVYRLPHTAKEAKAISPAIKKLTGQEPTVRMDKQALEAVFKSAVRPKVLVLSTHGYFLEDERSDPKDKERDRLMSLDSKRPIGKLPENPLLRCGLLFAGCNQREKAQAGEDDGVLTGLEIVGTDLRGTELVVLSACETGLGDVHNGEGVAGLRQAFQLAGAQSVVASLWKVPDEETSLLVTTFFDRLSQGKGKADAMRDAQLTLIESLRKKGSKNPHPSQWAAFTVTSQGKP